MFQILHGNQYGFRKKSSTHVALLTFIDKAIQAIENGEYAIGVFLDFSKAFDTVDHKILLDKLDHYGIRGCVLSWFRSYLSHIFQYVTYNGSQSSQQLIKCGVPQGSILDPLLFLVYINDLCAKVLNQCCLLMIPTCFQVALMPVVSRMGSIMIWLSLLNGSKLINYHWIKRKHISCVFQLKTSLVNVYLYKLTGKPLLKLINQNSWVWLLTTNWVGKIIYHLCVERLLVV